jgi:REP element-mobilizing transposase RayT
VHCVSTEKDNKNKFGPQSKNLASIIRGYKIGVTKKSKTICPYFKWQPNYFDHIIRNEEELTRIRQYIINNPIQWADDEYYS